MWTSRDRYFFLLLRRSGINYECYYGECNNKPVCLAMNLTRRVPWIIAGETYYRGAALRIVRCQSNLHCLTVACWLAGSSSKKKLSFYVFRGWKASSRWSITLGGSYCAVFKCPSRPWRASRYDSHLFVKVVLFIAFKYLVFRYLYKVKGDNMLLIR